MQLIFETCEPRPEVLTGELKEDIFAARLMDVILGKIDHTWKAIASAFGPATG